MHFTLIWIFKLTATLCAGLFTGAAIYITLVEHPARMKCGTDLAAMEFAAGYRRASVLQAFLAFTGFVSAMAAGGLSYTKGWYWGAAFLGSVIPYTLLAVFPTNHHLVDPTLKKDSPLARTLLKRWGRLHLLRSLLGLTSFVIFLRLLV